MNKLRGLICGAFMTPKFPLTVMVYPKPNIVLAPDPEPYQEPETTTKDMNITQYALAAMLGNYGHFENGPANSPMPAPPSYFRPRSQRQNRKQARRLNHLKGRRA